MATCMKNVVILSFAAWLSFMKELMVDQLPLIHWLTIMETPSKRQFHSGIVLGRTLTGYAVVITLLHFPFLTPVRGYAGHDQECGAVPHDEARRLQRDGQVGVPQTSLVVACPT